MSGPPPAEFCGSCGTPYVGDYCGVCGRSRAADAPVAAAPAVTAPEPAATSDDARRRGLRTETLVVMAAFWFPVTVSAIVGFAASYAGDTTSRFPSVVTGHPLENMLLGSLAYVTVGAVVPVTLYLLFRSGETTRSLGLWPLGARRDLLPMAGLAAASFAAAVAFLLILNAIPGVSDVKTYAPSLPTLPHYYVIEGLILAATTALVEETVMNGFLVTRLTQLGMRRGSILWLCAGLRMCYHAYYGWGTVVTVPFTLIMTGDFLRHRRLARVVGAHFVYDFTLITIAILH